MQLAIKGCVSRRSSAEFVSHDTDESDFEQVVHTTPTSPPSSDCDHSGNGAPADYHDEATDESDFEQDAHVFSSSPTSPPSSDCDHSGNGACVSPVDYHDEPTDVDDDVQGVSSTLPPGRPSNRADRQALPQLAYFRSHRKAALAKSSFEAWSHEICST